MSRFATLLVLGTVASGLVPGAPLPENSDYYPLKVGNKWVYRTSGGDTLTVQVSRIEKKDGVDRAVLEMLNDGKVLASEHLSSSARGVFRHRFADVEAPAPVCVLKYPLRKGEAWDMEMMVLGDSITSKARAGDAEEVGVPAGKYRAIPVRMEAQAGPIKFRMTAWYAPGVGMIKQVIEAAGQTTTIELEKFEEGK
jgi:hypothetical protein